MYELELLFASSNSEVKSSSKSPQTLSNVSDNEQHIISSYPLDSNVKYLLPALPGDRLQFGYKRECVYLKIQGFCSVK